MIIFMGSVYAVGGQNLTPCAKFSSGAGFPPSTRNLFLGSPPVSRALVPQ